MRRAAERTARVTLLQEKHLLALFHANCKQAIIQLIIVGMSGLMWENMPRPFILFTLIWAENHWLLGCVYRFSGESRIRVANWVISVPFPSLQNKEHQCLFSTKAEGLPLTWSCCLPLPCVPPPILSEPKCAARQLASVNDLAFVGKLKSRKVEADNGERVQRVSPWKQKHGDQNILDWENAFLSTDIFLRQWPTTGKWYSSVTPLVRPAGQSAS